MAILTAWQAVTVRLGKLPPGCKTLNNEELTFLLDSVDNARRQREQEIDTAVSDMFQHVPGVLHKTLRKILLM
jgi:hypothetical protein